MDEERQLWQAGDVECVMITCCAGAELQLRRIPADDIILRELYPMKSDLYERARELEREHRAGAAQLPGGPSDPPLVSR